jgi:signal transduction histidine kinase
VTPLWTWIAPLVEPSDEVSDPVARLEARFIATFHLLLTPLSLLSISLQAVASPELAAPGRAMMPFIAMMAMTWGIARTPYFRVATWFTMALAIVISCAAVAGDPTNPTPFAYFMAGPLLASVTLPSRDAVVTSLLNLVAGLTMAALSLPDLGMTVALNVAVMLVVITTMIGLTTRHQRSVDRLRHQELVARDQRQATLLAAAFGGLAVVRQGEVVDASPGFAALFGHTQFEVIGKPLDRFLVAQSEPKRAREAKHRNGKIFPVEVISHPYIEADQPQEVVAIQDLSERYAIQAQLHQADRMATMGQLAAGVAHEINNPLAWVLGNLDLLETRLTGGDAEVARTAADGARKVQHIVADLKTFSRTRPPDPVAVDLERTAASAANMVRHKIRDRGLLVESFGQVPSVDGDATRIGQVCLNLLVNAVEALPEQTHATNQVELSLYTNEIGEAIIDVTDNGPGIAPEVRHRMFDPFFTTKRQGTGLGMSITRSIVSSLGGRLEVRSHKGVGTTITVVLPRGKLRPTHTPVPSPPRRQNREEESPRLILVVDDEPDITALVSEILHRHRVHQVHGADEALLVMNDTWDVILCDLMMPGRTGMDLYEEAIHKNPQLASRFIFITGGAYTPRTEAFLDHIACPVLTKPFRMADLIATVEDRLRHRSRQESQR